MEECDYGLVLCGDRAFGVVGGVALAGAGSGGVDDIGCGDPVEGGDGFGGIWGTVVGFGGQRSEMIGKRGLRRFLRGG